MNVCLPDSPVGPKHREASGQDPHRPQQVDHRPELGAPPHVRDTDSWGDEEQGVQSCPSLHLMQRGQGGPSDSDREAGSGEGLLHLRCCWGSGRCSSQGLRAAWGRSWILRSGRYLDTVPDS